MEPLELFPDVVGGHAADARCAWGRGQDAGPPSWRRVGSVVLALALGLGDLFVPLHFGPEDRTGAWR